MRTLTTRRGGLGTFGLVAAAGMALAPSPASATDDLYSVLPETITLTGVARDFRERHVPGGHPDFERRAPHGHGHYVGIVANELDPDGKPAFAGSGRKVSSEWRDAGGRNISQPKPYIESRSGDRAGARALSDGGSVVSATTLSQWFRDTAGVNMSGAHPITLTRQPGTNKYVFDDRLDANHARLGGFFIVNDRLMGNSRGGNRNFHFTYELDTEFVYEEGAGQTFTFSGDDDVWVFIDGKLVIDIGGVHSRITQTIELDRLGWLEDGQSYSLKFFYAERHRTEANFRIETTLNLRMLELPAVAGLHD